jgi:hypothetical protein
MCADIREVVYQIVSRRDSVSGNFLWLTLDLIRRIRSLQAPTFIS